jgi:ParB-like chromosome segregation protein Spo0J
MILDGHHRLLKAINNNIETIKARVLDLSTQNYIKVCLVIKNKKSNYLNDKKVRQIYYRVFVRNYDIRNKYYIE